MHGLPGRLPGAGNVGLLRTGGDEDGGEGLEVCDELVEFVRLLFVVLFTVAGYTVCDDLSAR